MNNQLPDDILSQATPSERAALTAAWDAMDAALPVPDSGRMRRRFRRMIRRDLYGHWSRTLHWAGMAAMLLLGMVLGHQLAAKNQPSTDLEFEARLLASTTSSLQLQAIVNLRNAEVDLPITAIDRLAQILDSDRATVGLRLAALDALVAHRDQPTARVLLHRLHTRGGQNPLIEARLLEASQGEPASSI